MKRIVMKIEALMLIVLLCCAGFTPITTRAHAMGTSEYLSKIQNMESAFLRGIDVEDFSTATVKTPWGDSELVRFFQSNAVVGYYIILDGTILEFAESESPYDHMELSGRESYYYDFTTYGTIEGEPQFEGPLETDVRANQANKESLMRFDMTQDRSGYISGFPHIVQGTTDNCVACSLAHVIWYWGGHGYSALTSGYTYVQVKNTIHSLFYGYYANNSVLSVAQSYGSSHGLITFTGGAVWNPNFQLVVGEIDAGYPCLVGFKSPNPFYGSHMTACHGYNYYASTGNFYVVIADGVSTSAVSRIWDTSYNDCVIKLRIQ